ncbi:MAG: DUF1926 domain-containing protein [Treponema sp.]|nr:DUF1926 domain-containing protein [Treponema sp.]
MGKVSVCFDISCHYNPEVQDNFENIYSFSFKKMASFLYSHPNFQFSFYFSGVFFEWLDKNHAEFFSLLTELTTRKQIEILGGGFYEPFFPLIQPVDRIGQIEKLTTEIRKATGKKTRGLKLIHSVWDSTIISSLKTCGIEYVLIDNSLIAQSVNINNIHNAYIPFIVEDLGKTMTIFSEYKDKITESKMTPSEFVKKIQPLSKKSNNSVLCISFTPENIAQLIENKWFEELFDFCQTIDWLEFSTPQTYLKNMNLRIKANITPNASSEIMQWAGNAYVANPKSAKTENIRSFFYTYPESYLLYSRMMYTCMLNDQCRGDKPRKKFAREMIWEAQQNYPYIFDGKGGVSTKSARDKAYKALINAEKITREVLKSPETCHSLDLDLDGIPEYIFKFLQYNAFVTTVGGMLLEFDIFHNQRNYTNVMNRITHLDGVEDLYPKKMFIDHLIEAEQFDLFKKDTVNVNVVFANLVYNVHSFDRTRKELQLIANATFGSLEQPIFLRKKFIFSDNGVQVQYILKNASPLPLQGYFAVESNISFTGNSTEEQLIEVIASEAKEQACPNQIFIRQKNVSYVRLSDKISDVTFDFQPNENSGICIQPLNLSRNLQNINEKQYEATTFSFFWYVDIGPGFEVEKTLFMSIHTKENTSSKRKINKSL